MIPRLGIIAALGLGLTGVISGWVMWSAVAVAAVAILVDFVSTVVEARRGPAATGTAALVGRRAIARTPLTPHGVVFVMGERWRAELEDGEAAAGDAVTIVGANGYQLRVKRDVS